MRAADAPAARWRRLLWPGLLALLIHLLVLLFVNPQPAPVARTSILEPLIYTTPPPPPVIQATPAPRPHTPRRAPPRPAPAPEPMPAPALPAAEPEATSPPPAPVASEPPPAPAVVAAASAPQAAASAAAPPPPPVPPQAAIPGSVRLAYKIEGEIQHLSYHASGELLWAHDGKNYEARLEVGAFLLGSRVQSSHGRLTPAGLQPRRFVDKVRNDRVAEFDYEKNQIRLSEGGAPLPLPKDAQDQLSIFVQVGSQIGAAPQRYPSGTEVALPAVGVYGPETWRFVVGRQEKLQLPGGEQVALKLTRAGADEPHVEVWLAPALGWLPARIRLSQNNGDFIDQQWSSSEAP